MNTPCTHELRGPLAPLRNMLEVLKRSDSDDWDSTSSYGLGDVHNAIAVAQLAADYLKQVEADVTRDA